MAETKRPFVIGVTGKIACGKSSVLARLRDKGAETIDADQVYHELIRPRLPLWQALIDEFGAEIAGPGGEIDRRALGRIVFSDETALRRIDEITHPAISEELKERIATSSSDIVAIDAVKLVESGMDQSCDVVWRVECPSKAQIVRLMERNQIRADEASRRIDAQPTPPHSFRPEIVIDNSSDLNALIKLVDDVWATLFPARTN